MAKLLIVEDDKELNSIVCSYLESNGYETESCFNGADALKVCEQNSFNLVISDIMMPVLDGFSLVEKLRQKDTMLPIVFMSAREDKSKGFTR